MNESTNAGKQRKPKKHAGGAPKSYVWNARKVKEKFEKTLIAANGKDTEIMNEVGLIYMYALNQKALAGTRKVSIRDYSQDALFKAFDEALGRLDAQFFRNVAGAIESVRRKPEKLAQDNVPVKVSLAISKLWDLNGKPIHLRDLLVELSKNFPRLKANQDWDPTTVRRAVTKLGYSFPIKVVPDNLFKESDAFHKSIGKSVLQKK